MKMKIVAVLLVLCTSIRHTEICMIDSVTQIVLFEPEFEHKTGYLLFIDESCILRCNHEPGEQIDIIYFMLSTTGLLPSKIVINSTLNETYKGLFKLENYYSYSDLIVSDAGNIADGSFFECVGRKSTSSSSSLEIFVRPLPCLSDINSTSYSLQTSSDLVVDLEKFCCCHHVGPDQDRTHSAIVQCKSEISGSCSRLITFNVSLANKPNVKTRSCTLGPVCPDVHQQDPFTEAMVSQNMDTRDDHTGEPSKGKVVSFAVWMMVIPFILVICFQHDVL